MFSKKNEKNERKLVLNLPKNLLSVIGLVVKVQKEKRKVGLIAMHPTVKVVINLVEDHQEKKERSILHVVQHLVLAKKGAKVSRGVRKQRAKRKMNQWSMVKWN